MLTFVPVHEHAYEMAPHVGEPGDGSATHCPVAEQPSVTWYAHRKPLGHALVAEQGPASIGEPASQIMFETGGQTQPPFSQVGVGAAPPHPPRQWMGTAEHPEPASEGHSISPSSGQTHAPFTQEGEADPPQVPVQWMGVAGHVEPPLPVVPAKLHAATTTIESIDTTETAATDRGRMPSSGARRVPPRAAEKWAFCAAGLCHARAPADVSIRFDPLHAGPTPRDHTGA
jgi:hypothetical protein